MLFEEIKEVVRVAIFHTFTKEEIQNPLLEEDLKYLDNCISECNTITELKNIVETQGYSGEEAYEFIICSIINN